MDEEVDAIYAGDSVEIIIDFTPKDITGVDVFLAIKSNITDSDDKALLTFIEHNIDPVDVNFCVFNLHSLDTKKLPAGEYPMGIRYKEPDGTEKTFFVDTIIVLDTILGSLPT